MKNLHSEMCEQALLGLIMTDNANFGLIEGRISADDFYIPIHSSIFNVIESQINQGITAWPGSVLPAVLSDTVTEEYAKSYIREMFISAEMGGNILSAAHVIADMSFRRKLISHAKALNAAVESGNESLSAKIQTQIAELSTGHVNLLPDDPHEQLMAAFKLATEPEPMMASGINCWDDTFGGLVKGVRYIIAGRAGSGKTALALNMAWNVAKSGKKVRYIFFEGRAEEIWHRIMAREMNVPITSFRKGLNANQQVAVQSKQERIIGVDFAVVRDPKNVGEMIARCGACDLIVLDGMSSAPAQGADNLIEKVAMVTAYCKTMADKTGAAVIMLAHLNSEGIKSAGTGTGIFGGQAATFDPESIVELKADEDTKDMKLRRIDGIVTKNRYGELKTMKMSFNGEYMIYGDWN